MTWLERYGPWALVTGASEGIGRAIAEELAARGCHVVLVARRGAVLGELAATLRKQHGVQARVLAEDLSDADAMARIAAATEDIDIGLVVAAAGFGTSGPMLAGDYNDEMNLVDVNCRSVTATTMLFGRRLAQRGRGGLILMSSLLAFQGVARAANYAATKAYVQTLAEGLRLELGPLGVDVLSSAPGPVHSGFAARARMQMGMAVSPRDVARGTLDALGRKGTVRPGWLSVFLELSLKTLPRRGRVRVLSLVMGNMTKHHDGEAQVPGSA